MPSSAIGAPARSMSSSRAISRRSLRCTPSWRCSAPGGGISLRLQQFAQPSLRTRSAWSPWTWAPPAAHSTSWCRRSGASRPCCSWSESVRSRLGARRRPPGGAADGGLRRHRGEKALNQPNNHSKLTDSNNCPLLFFFSPTCCFSLDSPPPCVFISPPSRAVVIRRQVNDVKRVTDKRASSLEPQEFFLAGWEPRALPHLIARPRRAAGRAPKQLIGGQIRRRRVQREHREPAIRVITTCRIRSLH